MASAAVARKADTPSTEVSTHVAAPGNIAFEAGDIKLDRMRIVNALSDQFKMENLKVGDVYITADADDPNAEKILGRDEKPGVTFYVLNMTRHLSARHEGKFQQWPVGSPDAPANAKLAFEYTLCVPDVDPFLPVMYTMGGAAARTASTINKALLVNGAKGLSPWTQAFELTTTMKSNSNGDTWAAPIIKILPGDDAGRACAQEMAERLMADVAATPSATEMDPESDF